MRPIVHLLSILLLLVCVSTAAFTQGNKKSRDIYQTRDFNISFMENATSVSVSLHAKYVDSTDYYFICLADTMSKCFKLHEPLNYEYFRLELSKLLKGRTGDNTISTLSNLSIFYWIYTLKRDESEESLKIADLHLGKWVMANSNGYGISDQREREEKISTLTDDVTWHGINFKYYEEQVNIIFDRRLKSLSDTLMRIREAKERMKDTIIGLVVADQMYKTYRDNGKLLLDSMEKVSLAAAEKRERYIQSPDTLLLREVTMLEDSADQIRRTFAEKVIKNSGSQTAEKAIIDRYTLLDLNEHQFARNLSDLNSIVLRVKNHTIVDTNLYAALQLIKVFSVLDSSIILNMHRRYQVEKQILEAAEKKLAADNIFRVEKVSLQFERGFLERIQVWVRNKNGHEDIYENNFAIGVSAIVNFKLFGHIKLYIRKFGSGDYIYLSDVLGNYDNMLDLSMRDYSPADTAINHADPFVTPFITLRKERLVRLLDSRIYTDLVGLDEKSPNGLVQVEVARRFNINTYRYQLNQRSNIGFINYANISGGLTKIENKERYLPLRNAGTVVNNALISPSYVTNLDLRRYENLYLGVDVNAILLDIPDGKVSAYLDLGVRYGHTPVIDSFWAAENTGRVRPGDSTYKRHGHTITFELPKLTLEFFSERRIGFTLRYQYNITNLYSNNYFKQVMSDTKSDLNQLPTERKARGSHQFEFMLRLETSRADNGRVFLRARYFLQRGDTNNFFPQIQLGYAYNLLFRKD